MPWGSLADLYGTKALVQVSQISAIASNLALALAPNFSFAVASRFIAGLFNSITGAMKTNVAQSFHIKRQVRLLRG
jgi:MFS family permease